MSLSQFLSCLAGQCLFRQKINSKFLFQGIFFFTLSFFPANGKSRGDRRLIHFSRTETIQEKQVKVSSIQKLILHFPSQGKYFKLSFLVFLFFFSFSLPFSHSPLLQESHAKLSNFAGTDSASPRVAWQILKSLIPFTLMYAYACYYIIIYI